VPTADPADLVGSDPGAAYGGASAALVEATLADDVGERLTELQIGTVPGSVALGLALMDALTHGWDLATATEQPADIPSELAASALAFGESAIDDGMRGPGMPFKAALPPPSDASQGELLVAFLGRNPRP